MVITDSNRSYSDNAAYLSGTVCRRAAGAQLAILVFSPGPNCAVSAHRDAKACSSAYEFHSGQAWHLHGHRVRVEIQRAKSQLASIVTTPYPESSIVAESHRMRRAG